MGLKVIKLVIEKIEFLLRESVDLFDCVFVLEDEGSCLYSQERGQFIVKKHAAGSEPSP